MHPPLGRLRHVMVHLVLLLCCLECPADAFLPETIVVTPPRAFLAPYESPLEWKGLGWQTDPKPSVREAGLLSTREVEASWAGPVADFEPVYEVMVHRQLEVVNTELATLLKVLLGERFSVETYDPGEVASECSESDRTLMWMRDYQPIYVRQPDGRLKSVRYLSTNPNRSRYLPKARSDDGHLRLRMTAHGPFALPPVQDRRLPIEMLPLIHENGNLVSNGRFVFMTDLIFEDNRVAYEEPHLYASGYSARSDEEVLELLSTTFHRSVKEIIILKQMPGEATGHIDLFVLPIDEDTVAVPEVRKETFELLEEPIEIITAITVRRFLDGVATKLGELGLAVLRLPMVAPRVVETEDEIGEEDWELAFFSPTNALLLRTGDTTHAILPTFGSDLFGDAYHAIQRRYEAEWTQRLAKQGWAAWLVDASMLGKYLGLHRCVTAVVPL